MWVARIRAGRVGHGKKTQVCAERRRIWAYRASARRAKRLSLKQVSSLDGSVAMIISVEVILSSKQMRLV